MGGISRNLLLFVGLLLLVDSATSAVEPSSVGALWNLPLWEQYCIPGATDLLHARVMKQRYAHMDLLRWCD